MFPLFDILGPVINKVLDFIPDPKAKAEALAKAQEAAQAHEEKIITAFLASDQAQAAVNAKEAESASLFVSGWRPFIGWVCGVAFAWAYVLRPVIVVGMRLGGHPVDLPPVDISEMSGVLTGMLGLAGMRTYEKKQGIQGNH